ncbi:hypothetical protein QT397_02005 (plasmid) [Microbulbifer sp. MKSA007]|nr:hypothetical protein QT397_02005 [Microbulbifer sp. MKSA007]
MSIFRGRLFGFEAQHIIPKEAISGTTDEAKLARELLNSINFNVEARANKMMLFISSDTCRDLRSKCGGLEIIPIFGSS